MFIFIYRQFCGFFIIKLIKVGKGQSLPFHFKLKAKNKPHNHINVIQNVWIAPKNNQPLKDDCLQLRAAM